MNLFFDIGFHRGAVSYELRLLYPRLNIVGVEGHPDLVANFYEHNKNSGVILLNNVVSDKDDVLTEFTICDINPGINSINNEWIKTIRHSHFFDKSKRIIQVKSVTLDSLISKYGIPDLIKMDIEGAEHMALMGLTTKVPMVMFEWSEEWFSNTLLCVERLHELGFTEFASDSRWENIPSSKPEFAKDLEFAPWSKFDKSNINPKRKLRWGMVYAR